MSGPGALRGKKAVLVGLGTFGGGVGAAQYLSALGADLLVTDLRTEDDLGPSLGALQGLPIRYRLGSHRTEDVAGADLVVFSPAVPPDAPLVRAARSGRPRVTSPLNLLIERLPDRPVGITGTRGKTTTSTLIHAMLRAAGMRSALGGNVGGSLLTEIDRWDPRTVAVLEMSSFQLHWTRDLQMSPRLSVITNFSPHHLDWHGDLESYARSKRAILDFQNPYDAAVLNRDDEALTAWGREARGDVLWFSTQRCANVDAYLAGGEIRMRAGGVEEVVCRLDEIPIRGGFQASNVMAAALSARWLGADTGAIRDAVTRFPGLPHRLERVAEVHGIAFHNDSKATSPVAAAAAIEAFDGPIYWIGGGKEVGESFSVVARAAAGRVRAAFLLGEARERIARELAETVSDRVVCESLEEAVRLARERAREGATILFSPGCSSYDQFLNYEHRGDVFRDLVLGT